MRVRGFVSGRREVDEGVRRGDYHGVNFVTEFGDEIEKSERF